MAMDEFDLGKTVVGLSAGQKVFSRYTLRRVLGRGGMGVVWLAHDDKLEREIALKFLPEAVTLDSRALDDLKRETRRALALTHPYIVRIYDFVDDAHSAAIAMEWVDGPTLSKLPLERPNKVFEASELGPWVGQLCEALDYAHTKAQVVHRDLKPANLMLDAAGDMKVTDFGISATISDTATRVSRISGTSGTPVYMSPQQMLGDKPAASDDVYSLGATLYELLTGKPPFYTGNLIAQVQSKVPPSIAVRRAELDIVGSPVPAHWEETIAACLSKDPALRPRTAGEVATRLGLRRAPEPEAPRVQPHGESRSAAPGPEQTEEVRARPAPASRTPFYAGLATALVAVAGFGYYLGVLAPEQRRQEEVARAEAMRAAAARGGLIVRTTPEGAEVRIGAVALEKSPVTVKELKLGKYPVRVRLADYDDWDGDAVVKENEFAELSVALVRSTGAAQITSTPAGLPFTLTSRDKSLRGTTPGQANQLPTGDYVVAVQREGWPEQRRTLSIGRNQTAAFSAEFVGGGLEVTSVPSGAQVFVRGKRLGVTPLKSADLIPGAMEVEVRLAGYKTSTTPVTIRARQVERAAVALKPEPRRIADLDMELMPIAAGIFVLGSPEGEPGRVPAEGPPSTVRISRSFWIGKTEVTQGQWQTLMGFGQLEHIKRTLADEEPRSLDFSATKKPYREWWGRPKDEAPENVSGSIDPKLPMTFVSWDDATEFARRLTERERGAGRLPPGYVYRLPTEAEWEYACRAGTTTATYAGPIEILGKFKAPSLSPIAWYGGNSSQGFSGRGWDTKNWADKEFPGGLAGSREVASKQPNAWGCYDMIGNVAEWVHDTFEATRLSGDLVDPVMESGFRMRTFKGGSFLSEAKDSRAATRSAAFPASRFNSAGFRLCLGPEINEKYGMPPVGLNDTRAAYYGILLLTSVLQPGPNVAVRLRDGEIGILQKEGERRVSPAQIAGFTSKKLRGKDDEILIFEMVDRRGKNLDGLIFGLKWDAKKHESDAFKSKMEAASRLVRDFRGAVEKGNIAATVPAIFGYTPEIFSSRAEALRVVERVLPKNKQTGAASGPEGFNYGKSAATEPSKHRYADIERIELSESDRKIELKADSGGTEKSRNELAALLNNSIEMVVYEANAKGGRVIFFNQSDRAEVQRLRDALIYLMATAGPPSPPPPAPPKKAP